MIKAFYIIRKDLDMSPTKLAIQIGHGTDLIHIRHSEYSVKSINFDDWIQENRRKIVLGIKSEEKLNNILVKLLDDNIGVDSIYDEGYTEFDGKTLTGLIVHPIDEDRLPKAVKRLQLI